MWVIMTGCSPFVEGTAVEGADFLLEFDMALTSVGMMGVEESYNAIARTLFVLVVTSNQAVKP